MEENEKEFLDNMLEEGIPHISSIIGVVEYSIIGCDEYKLGSITMYLFYALDKKDGVEFMFWANSDEIEVYKELNSFIY